ncbi:AARF DOMAIN CONTAINING KINASE 2 (PREDICTED) [Salix purpurea]|uniref:AARF DOMAIN CONTAINING KINASE 2 (PREDICTED) n=1 Tax=Salix purpurea TaxID=77065 RepID=A0A9Q0WJV8_SALPP|nr:AARF DOMAIN CONTAINING KINASE 2 (PREDICTED) [Salix purpurea]
MSRFLTIGKFKKVERSICSKQKSSNGRLFEVKKYGTVVSIGLHLPQLRHHWQHSFPSRGYSSFALYNVKEQFGRRYFTSCYSSTSDVVTHNAQLAWKRLCRKGSASGWSFPRISRIAQAVTLALTRSHLVVPGALALTCGQVAWAQRTLVESDFYPNSLYMRAQDGHAYVTLLVSAVVDAFVLLSLEKYGFMLFIGHWRKQSCTPKLLNIVLPTRRKTIERAFGRKLSEIFEGFEEVPVASGSIAQVHRASLRYRYPGKKQTKPTLVAVKVRHPGVGESIRRDFMIINLVAKISTLIPTLNWLRLDESVQQFGVFMMSQPVYPLVHPAVLVESYEQGESVSHYVDDLEGHNRIKSALAHIGTHALLKMLLVDNFIHADMHPGNILVRLSQNIATRDGRTAAESALRLSKRQNCPNPKAFIEEVEEAFTFWGTPEGDLVHPADCMQQLLEKVRRHRVNIDGNVCTVMVTTLVLEVT